MESQINIKPNNSFFSCLLQEACECKKPTTAQLKSFSFRVPTSQSPAINVNLAIIPKNVITSMLVFISVINKNKCYINCLGPFFPLSHWTQWPTVMIHRMFSQSLYSLKTNRNLDIDFNSVQTFFDTSCAKCHVQITGRTEYFK